MVWFRAWSELYQASLILTQGVLKYRRIQVEEAFNRFSGFFGSVPKFGVPAYNEAAKRVVLIGVRRIRFSAPSQERQICSITKSAVCFDRWTKSTLIMSLRSTCATISGAVLPCSSHRPTNLRLRISRGTSIITDISKTQLVPAILIEEKVTALDDNSTDRSGYNARSATGDLETAVKYGHGDLFCIIRSQTLQHVQEAVAVERFGRSFKMPDAPPNENFVVEMEPVHRDNPRISRRLGVERTIDTTC